MYHMYIHTYIYIYIHTCIHAYIHTYIHFHSGGIKTVGRAYSKQNEFVKLRHRAAESIRGQDKTHGEQPSSDWLDRRECLPRCSKRNPGRFGLLHHSADYIACLFHRASLSSGLRQRRPSNEGIAEGRARWASQIKEARLPGEDKGEGGINRPWQIAATDRRCGGVLGSAESVPNKLGVSHQNDVLDYTFIPTPVAWALAPDPKCLSENNERFNKISYELPDSVGVRVLQGLKGFQETFVDLQRDHTPPAGAPAALQRWAGASNREPQGSQRRQGG